MNYVIYSRIVVLHLKVKTRGAWHAANVNQQKYFLEYYYNNYS